MNQFVINNLNYRDIICSINEIEGDVIYSGHKLAIDRKLFPFILQHWFDKLYNRFHFVDYYKWYEIYGGNSINREMTECFFNDSDSVRGLSRSYDSLLDLLGMQGKFKKINIVQK